MSGLDGALIDEATAGINAPADGDQLKIARVDNQQDPDLPNLTYQTVDDFVTEVTLPIANKAAAQAESNAGASSQNSAASIVDLALSEGYYYEATISGVAEDGAGGLAFGETRRLLLSYPTGGSPVIHDNDVSSSLPHADWALAASIFGTFLRVSITNAGATLRYVDVTIGISRARAIPAAP